MLKVHSQVTDAAELSTEAPSIPLSEVQSIVARLYGIEGTVSQLAGERDQNCCIEQTDGTRYVFKISNQSESASVVDFQIAALNHVAEVSPDLPIPRIIRTLSGQSCEKISLNNGACTTVRMLSYLEGLQIKETVRTPEQRRTMGTCLAKLDLSLHDFSHPAASHDLLWNVSAAHRLTDQLECLVNPENRRLASEFMARFKKYVLPLLSSLRTQVIHNDFHLYNVLVAQEEQDRITGIIDFGDMLYAPLVGEVATAAAFHMIGCADPFEGPAQFVGAYHKECALTDMEQEILADLMATRHLITALISEWRVIQYPDNRAYIMRHNPAAWEALSQMADISRENARDRLLSET